MHNAVPIIVNFDKTRGTNTRITCVEIIPFIQNGLLALNTTGKNCGENSCVKGSLRPSTRVWIAPLFERQKPRL